MNITMSLGRLVEDLASRTPLPGIQAQLIQSFLQDLQGRPQPAQVEPDELNCISSLVDFLSQAHKAMEKNGQP